MTMHDISHFFSELKHVLIPEKKHHIVREILIGSGIVILVVGGGVGYYFYQRTVTRTAFDVLAEYVAEYQRSRFGKGGDEWMNIENYFQMGYDQYSRSKAAPYYLVFQADALLQQNKKDEALPVLDKAIAALGSSPLVSLYKHKKALIQLDMPEQATREAGLTALRELSQDKANTYSDISAYYLGLYYWMNDDLAHAKEVWQALVDAHQGEVEQAASPWAAQAKELLEQCA